MKKVFAFLAAVLITASLWAQSPEKMSYQAVIRNSSNALVTSTQIGMEINIRQGSPSGTVVYTETQTPTTNANGLASIEIGGGTGFDTINWANGPYFIETNTAVVPPLTTYTITGTSQLLSVPYALHAKKADSITGGITETDPIFSASPSFGILDTNIANWNAAHSWGNHALAGYLTSFTETDPVFGSHVASGITPTDIINWNDAFGWGNHASVGYLTSFTELDPKVGANTTNYISKWNGTSLISSSVFDNDTNVGIGTATPSAKLEIAGQVKITGGTPGAGKVLTSDATGLGTWQIPTGITGTGNNNYHIKWTTAGSVLGNSMIQDNGTGVSVNGNINTLYQMYVYRQQLLAIGDGQATIMGLRNRDVLNDGNSFAQNGSNTGVTGHNFWGDQYSFGVGGWNFNDYNRCGGVIGGEINAAYWGILGYKSSASVVYGVYGSNAYGFGSGKSNTSAGVGVAGVGSLMGSWFRGQVYGSIVKGDRMSLYVDGKSYTNEVITQLNNNGSEQRFATYVATSMTVDVYMKGKGQLVNGKTEIKFDPNYQSLISDEDPIIVTVTPIGKSNGIYIEEIKGDGFSVAENNDGESNIVFTWIAVATRKGYENPSNPIEIMDTIFDKHLNSFMFNESDSQNSAQPMWWDGTKINYTPIPQEPIIKEESE